MGIIRISISERTGKFSFPVDFNSTLSDRRRYPGRTSDLSKIKSDICLYLDNKEIKPSNSVISESIFPSIIFKSEGIDG